MPRALRAILCLLLLVLVVLLSLLVLASRPGGTTVTGGKASGAGKYLYPRYMLTKGELVPQRNRERFEALAAERGLAPVPLDRLDPSGRPVPGLRLVETTVLSKYRKRWDRLEAPENRDYLALLNTPAEIKGLDDAASKITNKIELNRALSGDVTRETHVYPAGGKGPSALPGEGLWIWRPEAMGKGHWIEVISTGAELAALRRRLARRFPWRRSILSRYIEDPELYRYKGGGYKFHLRVALLAVVDRRGGRRLIMWKKGMMFLSERPYAKRDYKNKAIHDTHASSAVAARRFPEEYQGDAGQMTAKIADLFARMAGRLMAHEAPDKNSEAGVARWGADVMIDADGRPWLLEVNSHPGWARVKKLDAGAPSSGRWLAEGDEFIEMMWGYAYDPLLGLAPRPVHSEDFVEVYSSPR